MQTATHGGQGAPFSVCVFINAGPIAKLFAWGEGDVGGHVLRETDEPFVMIFYACVFITAVPITKLFARGGGRVRVH
jgi:hypothetical protein